MEITATERLTLFDQALSLIHDDDIRDFTEQLLIDADDYFFIEPASSSGKYHPQYALGNGGLARHSIAVALILNGILECNCYEFTDKERDLLICSAIVHDIKKYGDGKKHTVKEHPELASKYILSEQKNGEFIPMEDSKFISEAVKTHMGQWGSEKPETNAQKLLHIADCLASRKWLDVKFDNPEIAYKEVSKEEEDPGEYIMPFGKYKGSKLKEVDPSYLDFLVNTFSYKSHPVVNKARKILKELKD